MNSLFGDGTWSLGDDREGVNIFVTETTEETQENHIDDVGQGELVAKAKPKQTSMPTTSSPTITLTYHQREWIDVEPGQYDEKLFRSVKR